jgi:hypothetical protein
LSSRFFHPAIEQLSKDQPHCLSTRNCSEIIEHHLKKTMSPAHQAPVTWWNSTIGRDHLKLSAPFHLHSSSLAFQKYYHLLRSQNSVCCNWPTMSKCWSHGYSVIEATSSECIDWFFKCLSSMHSNWWSINSSPRGWRIERRKSGRYCFQCRIHGEELLRVASAYIPVYSQRILVNSRNRKWRRKHIVRI